MKLTIHGYATALFASWYFIEELGLLFDAGDGLTANLLGKCGKIKNIFISHADRDHLTGLMQYTQLFGHHKPAIHFPKDAGSFKHMEQFLNKFDPHISGCKWIPIADNSKHSIKQNYLVEAFENKHIERSGELKSLSFKVFEEKRKLKKEFLKLSKQELIAIKEEKGDAYISEKVRTNILTYSGDTPVYDHSVYENSQILIHEATFLKKEEANTVARKNKHSSLEEVMQMVSEINISKLILGHFSSRYYQDEIDTYIRKLIKQHKIDFPVYRIPIGKTKKDILANDPIN